MQTQAQIEVDIMTPERLRQYWFGPQRVPFWNFDPAQLTIGLELEYFIGRTSPTGLELATKSEYLSVMAELCKSFNYSDKNLADQPGRISKDTRNGFIAIKPDFAWHILEIALPPRRTREDIKSLIEDVFSEVDFALNKVGLQRLDLSCLPDVPERMELVELDRLMGYQAASAGNDAFGKALGVFPALIAATHVHVNCCSEESLKALPRLYNLDFEISHKFTRAKLFQGRSYNNLRTMFYELGFGDNYRLRTVPKNIPDSIDSYVEAFNASSKIFPNDTFFPSRDMSYIRPTRRGTIEFRSTCSYLDPWTLLEIAESRRRQVIQGYSSSNFLLSGGVNETW